MLSSTRLCFRTGIDHNMGRKPWASALRLISRNALASGSARLTIDPFGLASQQDHYESIDRDR
jgi:hypothetical protein